MRKRDICLWRTSSSSWEWEPHCYATGHSIFYITRSLLKLTWSLNKKNLWEEKKKKKRVTYFFQLLNRFLGHISPPLPLQVFSRMEFSSSHSRIWRGQSTTDAAELRNQKPDSFFPWILCYHLDWVWANVKGCKSERQFYTACMLNLPQHNGGTKRRVKVNPALNLCMFVQYLFKNTYFSFCSSRLRL